MKKVLSIILVAALAMPMFAGEKETPEQKASKDYSSWLPAAGDFSIGFGLDPIATFVGNMFSGATATNTLGDLAGEPMLVDALPGSMVSIMGSYMLTNQLSAKLNIGFGMTTFKDNVYAIDDYALMMDPLSEQKVVDSRNDKELMGSIALGIEYRVGKNRPVQGVFGAGLNYAFGQESTSYNYGNAITEVNQVPSVNGDWGTYTSLETYMPNARLISRSSDIMHYVGVYTSVGVEWFVAPKIALGANVNLSLIYGMTPKKVDVYEGWNTASMKVENYTNEVSPASHGLMFGTNNFGANLYIAFYLK